jgi:hypothetical protein
MKRKERKNETTVEEGTQKVHEGDDEAQYVTVEDNAEDVKI